MQLRFPSYESEIFSCTSRVFISFCSIVTPFARLPPYVSSTLQKLVLPEKDTKFPRIDGVPFEAKTRWFSFSQAQMPWEEYMDLQKDARACRPVTRDGGDKTFFLEGALRMNNS